MITAKEAREMTIRFQKRKMEEELVKLDELINQSISRKETKAYWYEALSSASIEHLKLFGYEVVNCSSQKEGECYIISW